MNTSPLKSSLSTIVSTGKRGVQKEEEMRDEIVFFWAARHPVLRQFVPNDSFAIEEISNEHEVRTERHSTALPRRD